MSDFAEPAPYKLTIGTKRYVSHPDITNTDPRNLIRGSINVMINDQEKCATRFGYRLLGAVGSVDGAGIQGSFDWATSTGVERNLRSWINEAVPNSGTIEWLWDYSTWYTLVTGLSTGKCEATKWWDDQEKQDIALICNGTPNLIEWSGATSEVSGATANSISKTGDTWAQERWYRAGNITANTIAFVNSNPDTITDTGLGFIAAGFRAGQRITVSGSASNNGTYTIASVAAGTITLIPSDSLTNEAAGAGVTIRSVRQITVVGRGTFTYTGGEGTNTLTGVTPNPAAAGVVSGDVAFQTVRTHANVVGSSYNIDDIDVLYNQIYLVSGKSSEMPISANDNFLSFVSSNPRLPGEGTILTLDGNGVALENQENSMYIAAGDSSIFEVEFILSADLQNETVKINKLQTSNLQAPMYPSGMAKAKNNIVFMSREPVFNLLGRVTDNFIKPQTQDISNDIKDDLEVYDFTTKPIHINFWRAQSYVAIPAENTMIIYNWDKGFWQAPQLLPVSRVSIINGWIHGHSSYTNETYKLFDPEILSDRYIDISNIGFTRLCIARYSYNNYSNDSYSRANPKNFTTYFSEGYISTNTIITMSQFIDYRGASGIQEFDIDGSDECILYGSPENDNSLGKHPLGKKPLGSFYYEDILDEQQQGIFKFRQIDTSNVDDDFFEMSVQYASESENAYFEILSHGPDVGFSSTLPKRLMK